MIKKEILYHRVALILLTVIVFAVYAQVISFKFINMDDNVYVTKNYHVQQGISRDSLIWALTTTSAGFWHPTTWLSHIMDSQIYGTWAGGHHLTNLLLHIANSLLLLFIFRKMTGSFWKSWFLAALFALHPLHVESVAWVSERKDVLSTFWGLLTIYSYVHYAEHTGVKRYLLTFLFFFIGLMAKPVLVTIPFVLLLLDYWPLQRISFKYENLGVVNSSNNNLLLSERASVARLIWEKIPLLILAVPFCVVTFFAERNFGAFPISEYLTLNMRLSNAIISYVRYIGKMLFPLDLSVYYPHPGLWPLWQVVISASLLLLMSFVFLKKAVSHKYLSVGWLWYLGTLVPVIGLIQVGAHAMADRYSYIPLIGLSIIIAWGAPDLISQWRYKKLVLGVAGALIILVLSVLSWQRCQLWGDKVALWDDFLKKNEAAGLQKSKMIPFAYIVRGFGYSEKGQYQLAINDYNAALLMDRNAVEALNDRAIAYSALGKHTEAFRDFAEVLRLKPQFADAYFNRGILYKNIGKYSEAIADFTQALSIEKDMADALNNRGIVFGHLQQYYKALADFNEALKINQNFAEAYYNRGILYNILKKYDLAFVDFAKAVKIKPDYADAYNSMAIALQVQGKVREALEYYLIALKINPSHISAHNNIAIIFANSGNYEAAITHFQKVLQIKPDYPDAAKNLQTVLEKRKKTK